MMSLDVFLETGFAMVSSTAKMLLTKRTVHTVLMTSTIAGLESVFAKKIFVMGSKIVQMEEMRGNVCA